MSNLSRTFALFDNFDDEVQQVHFLFANEEFFG